MNAGLDAEETRNDSNLVLQKAAENKIYGTCEQRIFNENGN